MRTITHNGGNRTFWLEAGEIDASVNDARRWLVEHGRSDVHEIADAEIRMCIECYEEQLNRDEYDETNYWEAMFQTDFYVNHGETYCSMQSWLGTSYLLKPLVLRVDKERRRRFDERQAEQFRHERFGAMYGCGYVD